MSEQSLRPRADRNAVGPILVTGGTGFLGSALVGRLLANGAKVRVLVRREAQAREQSRLGVEPIVGDITNRSSLEAGLDGVIAVYHLAGKLLEPGEPPDQYGRTHVEGTKLLLHCAQQETSVRRFVHCSTTGVLGPTGDTPAGEAAPIRPSNVYEATKAEAELAVRAAMEEGFPGVVVRPGLVYGPGDWHLVKFYDSILRRRFRPIGRRDVWLHPIFIDDMIDAFLRCGTEAKAVGECFHISGEAPVSLSYLAETVAYAGGTTLPRARIPIPAAWVIATACDLLPSHLRHHAPLTRNRLDFLTHSRVYDVEKARELLGFAAPTDLVTGIRGTMAWYFESVSKQPVRPSRQVALVD